MSKGQAAGLDKGLRLRSPGLRSEMIFHRFNGEVIDRGAYLVVRTPDNPGFYFGNLLVFFEAPGKGSAAVWRALFAAEFADNREIRHCTLAWDAGGVRGELNELAAAGFEVSQSVVLRASAVRAPAKMHAGVIVRPLAGDEDWRAAAALQIACRSEVYEAARYAVFKELQMARYREMAAAGLGQWFGAFLDGRLVGDLGLFREATLGRFQQVETHPDFFRQGICGRLVYEAARYGLEEMRLSELVMVADEHYHAARIYESAGFTPVAREYSACWWERGK